MISRQGAVGLQKAGGVGTDHGEVRAQRPETAAVGEERGTIEDVIEPYLIQQGFMMRTARGRVATKNAYLHLGLKPPASPQAAELPLFKED